MPIITGEEAWLKGFEEGWKLNVSRNGAHWECVSPKFGKVEYAVVSDENGNPLFDRPRYHEAPNVNCVVWGRGSNGKARFAVIRQPRPHSYDPENPGENHKDVVFGQIVMGFLEKLIGKDLVERYESVAAGAVREASEESGVTVVLNIERPAYPWHNPNPTFVATWSDLVFVEVDLERIEELKSHRNEPIFSAEYITAEELRQRVADGKDEAGAVYRMCTANSAWFIFFCTHPELF